MLKGAADSAPAPVDVTSPLATDSIAQYGVFDTQSPHSQPGATAPSYPPVPSESGFGPSAFAPLKLATTSSSKGTKHRYMFSPPREPVMPPSEFLSPSTSAYFKPPEEMYPWQRVLTEDLCGCCADPCLFLSSFFCAPCIAGQNFHLAGRGSWYTGCLLTSCVCGYQRQHTQRILGVSEQSACAGFCLHLWCRSCAVTQEARALRLWVNAGQPLSLPGTQRAETAAEEALRREIYAGELADHVALTPVDPPALAMKYEYGLRAATSAATAVASSGSGTGAGVGYGTDAAYGSGYPGVSYASSAAVGEFYDTNVAPESSRTGFLGDDADPSSRIRVTFNGAGSAFATAPGGGGGKKKDKKDKKKKGEYGGRVAYDDDLRGTRESDDEDDGALRGSQVYPSAPVSTTHSSTAAAAAAPGALALSAGTGSGRVSTAVTPAFGAAEAPGRRSVSGRYAFFPLQGDGDVLAALPGPADLTAAAIAAAAAATGSGSGAGDRSRRTSVASTTAAAAAGTSAPPGTIAAAAAGSGHRRRVSSIAVEAAARAVPSIDAAETEELPEAEKAKQAYYEAMYGGESLMRSRAPSVSRSATGRASQADSAHGDSAASEQPNAGSS